MIGFRKGKRGQTVLLFAFLLIGASTGYWLRGLPAPMAESQSRIAADAPTLRDLYSRPPAEWPAPALEAGIEHRELGLIPRPEHPAENPWNEEKQELGRILFFETRLSASRQISCSHCHVPEHGWAEDRAISRGAFGRHLPRNAPGILGVGYRKELFWDGRAASLEDQAREVILNNSEMAATEEMVVSRLAALENFYPPRFQAAFGDPAVTFERVLQALACFQRAIPFGTSDFDRFLRGEHDQLSDDAIEGLHLFRTQARCMNCHSGPHLTDEGYHNLGLHYYGRKLEDLGRWEVTGVDADAGRFRTPSLRNCMQTLPWAHNGLFRPEGFMNAYNHGMARPPERPRGEGRPPFPHTDDLLVELDLDPQQRNRILDFLRALDERPWRVREALSPPVQADEP